MNKNERKLTPDELKAVLQKHYRQFITGVKFKAFADGRLYVAVEFSDNGESDESLSAGAGRSG